MVSADASAISVYAVDMTHFEKMTFSIEAYRRYRSSLALERFDGAATDSERRRAARWALAWVRNSEQEIESLAPQHVALFECKAEK